MRRIITTTLLCLTMFGGVASAQRYRGDHHRSYPAARYNYQPRSYVRSYNRSYVPSYNRGYYNRGYYSRGYYPRYYNRGYYSRGYYPRYYNRGYYNNYYYRRPIFVTRPYIGFRYYNYYQRPALLVENYPPMAGYYWVSGYWYWSGYEWLWQPGHYEPSPVYDYGYGAIY
jgi:hypothetical protein